MMNLEESVSVSFTDWNRPGSIPRWARGLNTQRNTIAEISKAEDLPEIIVLTAPNPRVDGLQRRRIHEFVERLEQSTRAITVVISFTSKRSAEIENMVEVLRLFPPKLCSNIEISSNRDSLEESLKGALAKYFFIDTESERDSLANAKNVVKAVRPLLAPSGRLSAKAIAAEFGLPVAQLARQMGQSRQALGKTPDARSVQMQLRPYERVFRLRSIFSKSDFLAWLEQPNRELENSSPKEIISDGRVEIVADLVEDMLLGAPA